MKTLLRIILILCFGVCLLTGCGGGTEGTGGITLSGTVENERHQPLAGVVVSIPSANDPNGFATVTTDSNGQFELYADSQTDYQVVLVKDGVRTEVSLDNIPTTATQVTATVVIDTTKPGVAIVTDIQATRETEIDASSQNNSSHSEDAASSGNHTSASSDDGSVSNISPTPTDSPQNHEGDELSGLGISDSSDSSSGGSSSGQESDENEVEDDDFNSIPTPNPTASPIVIPTPEPGEDSNNESSQTGSSSQEGDRTVSGSISDLSTSSITVSGTTFLINHETEFKDIDGEDSNISQFTTGDRVKVKGEYEHGVLVAHEVAVKN